jgi:hypothetical protein
LLRKFLASVNLLSLKNLDIRLFVAAIIISCQRVSSYFAEAAAAQLKTSSSLFALNRDAP